LFIRRKKNTHTHLLCFITKVYFSVSPMPLTKLNYFFHSFTPQQLVNVNDQISDMNSQKLVSLVNIQKSFPNDDLKLFDKTVTPSKFHQATPQSASSLTQTVKSVKSGLSKFNLIHTTTPVSTNGKSSSIFSTLKVIYFRYFLKIRSSNKNPSIYYL